MKKIINRFSSLLGASLQNRKLNKHLKENAAQGQPLSVMDDLVFKAMLTMDTEDSREALRCLVSACTRREVSDVHVLNNELNPARLDGKSARLDVKASFNDGEIANLEMQINKTDDDLKNRAAYYSAMLLSGQAGRGQPYKKIKRVYQIFFLNCILFPHSEKLPRLYKFMEVEEHDHLTEVVEIIFYELPKLERLVKEYFEGKIGMENLSIEEKWCIFMRYRDNKQTEPLIKELFCEEGIMRAERSLEKVSRNYKKFLRDMDRKKNEYEKWVMLEAARKEGLEQGHQEILAFINGGGSMEELKVRLEQRSTNTV